MVRHTALTQHPRNWRDFAYVYPVISRRAGGLSIGVNVNPDKACNFDCAYCQVDRTQPPPFKTVNLERLHRELETMLALVKSQAIWQDPAFAGLEPHWQRLNDIAFSGDGEPTTYRRLDAAVRLAVEARNAAGIAGAGEKSHASPVTSHLSAPFSGVKIVLVTNATCLHWASARRAVEIMDAAGGEVWAKLDAGTPEYYRLIDRTRVPLARVLRNIAEVGHAREIVIQSMFLRWAGAAVSADEYAAYLRRLEDLMAGGCRIKLVQLYTVARRPVEARATALTAGELGDLAEKLSRRLPGLAVEVYP